jgi:hypothetical protein
MSISNEERKYQGNIAVLMLDRNAGRSDERVEGRARKSQERQKSYTLYDYNILKQKN